MNEHLTEQDLYELADGALTGGARRRAELHLTACDRCARALAAIGAVERAAVSLPLAATSDRFTAMVMDRLPALPAQSSVQSRARSVDERKSVARWSARIAGALAVAALYIWFLIASDSDAKAVESPSRLVAIADAIGSALQSIAPIFSNRGGALLVTAVAIIAILVTLDRMIEGKMFRPRS